MTHDDTRPSPADMAAFSGARTQSAPLRVPEQPLQIPEDLREHLKALEEYRRLVEEIAKVDQLLDQAQARRDEIAERLRDAQEVMRFTDPSRRGRRHGPKPGSKRAPKAAAETQRHPLKGRSLEVIGALPGTNHDVASRLGMDIRGASAMLANLTRHGHVVRDGDTFRPVEASA